jgi:AAA15 family ATPase/GTPase
MLQNITIENFKCFEKAHFSGFGKVNLLGGKNNAGKTALLEAIYVFMKATENPIPDIYRYRKFDMGTFSRNLGEKIFDNLFFKQDNKVTIKIKSDILKGKMPYDFVEFQQSGNLYARLFSSISEKHLSLVFNYNLSIKGARNVPGPNYDFKFTTIFIPTDYRMASIDLVRAYEDLEMKGQEEKLLHAFQLIDNDIERIKTFTQNPLSLYIKKKDNYFMPIDFFGDALNKMAYYILQIIKAENGILLIDEIENGLHHTHQAEFWEMILKIALDFKVQIFATTHSKEMTEAFQKVVAENYSGEDIFYFEMARHIKTNEIIAQKMDNETLGYKLAHNKPFRGE